MEQYLAAWTDKFVEALPNILTAILILVVSYYAGVLLGRVLKRVLERHNAEVGVIYLLSRGLKWTIISLGFIAALQIFFNVTAFLAGLGIIGFTIGFALQNIMQNFVSGVILLVQQPFKVGHVVSVAGYDGTVLKIGLRTTEMKTLDGRLVFLPNADVLSQPIINFTRASLRRVDLPIGVSYSADPENVRNLILAEVKDIPGCMNDPEPTVLFQSFGASSIDLTLFFWVDTTITSNVAAKDAVLVRIKKAFAEAGIDIPSHVQVELTSTQDRKPVKRKIK